MPSPTAWSREEIELIVADYLSMLIDERRGVAYNKAAHRKALLPKLKERSEGSIEYKHQNISAVLLDMGYPPIDGYKPAWNFQGGLFPGIVQQQAESNQILQALLERSVLDPQITDVPSVSDILSALVSTPERREQKPKTVRESLPTTIARKKDYLQLEAANAKLGLLGEKFALNFEMARLIHAGKESLARKVEHSSVVEGDGLGYDIRSYEENGRDRLIEVKTTRYGRYAPFYLTKKELQVSQERSAEYHLYRLFHFVDDPKMFALTGKLDGQLLLTPTQYLAEL